MLALVSIVLVLVLLTGCGAARSDPSGQGEDDYSRFTARELCAEWHATGGQALKDELERRDVLSDREWSAAEQGELFKGMSESGLFCSRGRPGPHGDVQETHSERAVGGRLIYGNRYEYRDCEGCPATYVYVENGEIIVIRD